MLLIVKETVRNVADVKEVVRNVADLHIDIGERVKFLEEEQTKMSQQLDNVEKDLARHAKCAEHCTAQRKGFGERGLCKRGPLRKVHFSSHLREQARESREPSDCGKPRRIRPFSLDSRDFGDLEIVEIPPIKRTLL